MHLHSLHLFEVEVVSCLTLKTNYGTLCRTSVEEINLYLAYVKQYQ